MNDLARLMTYSSLAVGALLVIVGVILLAMEQASAQGKAKKALSNAARAAEAASKDAGTLAEQADSLGGAFEGLSKLAAALKDLDVSTRLIVLGLGFFAVAGLSAGLDAVGEGLAGTGA